jgi:chromosome segregation ATPase
MTETTPSGFENLMILARLMADPRALQAQLDGLMAAGVKARDAEKAAERAVTAMKGREADLDSRERRLDTIRNKLGERAEVIEARHAELKTMAAELRRIEGIIRWRVANHAGALEGLDPTLMQVPSWQEIDARLDPIDAHYPSEEAAVAVSSAPIRGAAAVGRRST